MGLKLANNPAESIRHPAMEPWDGWLNISELSTAKYDNIILCA